MVWTFYRWWYKIYCFLVRCIYEGILSNSHENEGKGTSQETDDQIPRRGRSRLWRGRQVTNQLYIIVYGGVARWQINYISLFMEGSPGDKSIIYHCLWRGPQVTNQLYIIVYGGVARWQINCSYIIHYGGVSKWQINCISFFMEGSPGDKSIVYHSLWRGRQVTNQLYIILYVGVARWQIHCISFFMVGGLPFIVGKQPSNPWIIVEKGR